MYVGFEFHFDFSILIKQIHQYIRLHTHGCQVWHFISAQEEKEEKGDEGGGEKRKYGCPSIETGDWLNKLLLL